MRSNVGSVSNDVTNVTHSPPQNTIENTTDSPPPSIDTSPNEESDIEEPSSPHLLPITRACVIHTFSTGRPATFKVYFDRHSPTTRIARLAIPSSWAIEDNTTQVTIDQLFFPDYSRTNWVVDTVCTIHEDISDYDMIIGRDFLSQEDIQVLPFSQVVNFRGESFPFVPPHRYCRISNDPAPDPEPSPDPVMPSQILELSVTPAAAPSDVPTATPSAVPNTPEPIESSAGTTSIITPNGTISTVSSITEVAEALALSLTRLEALHPNTAPTANPTGAGGDPNGSDSSDSSSSSSSDSSLTSDSNSTFTNAADDDNNDNETSPSDIGTQTNPTSFVPWNIVNDEETNEDNETVSSEDSNESDSTSTTDESSDYSSSDDSDDEFPLSISKSAKYLEPSKKGRMMMMKPIVYSQPLI